MALPIGRYSSFPRKHWAGGLLPCSVLYIISIMKSDGAEMEHVTVTNQRRVEMICPLCAHLLLEARGARTLARYWLYFEVLW